MSEGARVQIDVVGREDIQNAREKASSILRQAQLDVDTVFLQAQLAARSNETKTRSEESCYSMENDADLLTYSELSLSHKQLQSQFDKLSKEYKALQDKFAKDSDDWNKFRDWWRSVVARKSSRMHSEETTSSPSTPPSKRLSMAEESSASGLKKRRLTREEREMFQRLGMEGEIARENGEVRLTKEESASKAAVRTTSEDRRDDSKASPDRRLSKSSNDQKITPVDRLPLKEDLSSQANFAGSLGESAPDKGSESTAEDRPAHERLRQGRLRKIQELKSDPGKFKGRGRYAVDTSREEVAANRSINAEYEVDPEKNGGVNFPHKAVVREKAQRKVMHAFDCPCCEDWYLAVGPPAPRPFDGRKRSASLDTVGTQEQERLIQEHRQLTSRHRAYGPPDNTPPGYWDIGFPSTQKQEELNRLAEEGHKRKKERMASDPRFKKRQG